MKMDCRFDKQENKMNSEYQVGFQKHWTATGRDKAIARYEAYRATQQRFPPLTEAMISVLKQIGAESWAEGVSNERYR